MSEQLLEVAFRHPIRLIANALGIAPPSMIERVKKHGVPVGARAGNSRSRELVSYFVGQRAGLVDQVKSASTMLREFKEEFAEAAAELADFTQR